MVTTSYWPVTTTTSYIGHLVAYGIASYVGSYVGSGCSCNIGTSDLPDT